MKNYFISLLTILFILFLIMSSSQAVDVQRSTKVSVVSAYAWPAGCGGDYSPPKAVDNSNSTYTWSTGARAVGTHNLGVAFSDFRKVNRIRLYKDNDDGYNGGPKAKNLIIQYTTDTNSIYSRTWHNVTNLVNGFLGSELMNADAVNTDGTVTNDRHYSPSQGYASLSFDTVEATGLRITFSHPDNVYNHYKIFEFAVYYDHYSNTENLLTINWSSSALTVTENSGSIYLTSILNGMNDIDIEIPYTISGTALGQGIDFSISTEKILIPAWEKSGYLKLSLIDDYEIEDNENITISLGSIDNIITGITAAHYIYIIDDDAKHPIISSISPNSSSYKGGIKVTITGSFFGNEQRTGKVFFGNQEALSYDNWSHYSIICEAPPLMPGTIKVNVLKSNEKSSITPITFSYYAKIYPHDATSEDRFGNYVSISDDYAIVGSYWDDDNGSKSGSAYIFKRQENTWVEHAKIKPSDGDADTWFAWSVAIYGDYALVGCRFDNEKGDDSGSAYIFKREGNSWIEQQKLSPDDGSAGDEFGECVSIYENYALISAYHDNVYGEHSGSVYIFKRDANQWVQQAKLFPDQGLAGEIFGESVSIFGDYVIVGACGNNEKGDYTGAAYVFKREGNLWKQQAKLISHDRNAGHAFGYNVSIYKEYAMVGACGVADNGTSSGAAYIFKQIDDQWIEQVKLLPDDNVTKDHFGRAIFLHDQYAVIGSAYDDDNGEDSGSLYIYKNENEQWKHLMKINPDDGESNDLFGLYASMSGDNIITSSLDDDDKGLNSGSAYIFNLQNLSDINSIKNSTKESLISYYPFDNQINNLGNSSSHLIAEGDGVAFTLDHTDIIYSAFEFTGNNWIHSSQSFIFNQSNDATLMFWMKLSNLSQSIILQSTDEQTSINKFTIRVNDINDFSLIIEYTSKQAINHKLFEVPVLCNQWIHIAISRQDNTYALYVNGQLEEIITDENLDLPDVDGNWTWGKGENSIFKGAIDDIRIYDKALSESEIGYLYQVKPPSFVEIQSIPTSGASDWECFTINDETYIAVSNLKDNNSSIAIYKWNGLFFDDYQKISGNTAQDLEWFDYNGDIYLSLASKSDGQSKLFKWDGDFFQYNMDINANCNMGNWDTFKLNTERYIAVANTSIYNSQSGHDYIVDSVIYKWTGTSFDLVQTIPTSAATSWEFFSIDNKSYLALNQNYDQENMTYKNNAKIFEWQNDSFVNIDTILSNGGLDWEYIMINNDHFLALACSYDDINHNIDSKIYKWNGSSFIEYQSIPTFFGVDWESFDIYGKKFLVIANHEKNGNYNIDSTIYQWDGSYFQKYQNIRTDAANCWKCFKINGDTYLAVANSYKNESYNTNSKIYKWIEPEMPYSQSISITPINDKTYGDEPFQLLATSSSGLDITFTSLTPEVITINKNVATIINAGDATIRAYQSGNDLYNPAESVDFHFNVKKKTLLASSISITRCYGENIPLLDIQYSGFVNSDTIDNLDIKPTVNCSVDNLSDAGTYTIYMHYGQDKNYSFQYEYGKVNITKQKLTVMPENVYISYGNSIPTFKINYSGFVNSDTPDDLNSKPVASCSATNKSDVNIYPIYVQDGEDNNYDFKYINGNLTITKRQLTAAAQDETIIYGNSVPTFTINYSGFVNSDTSYDLNSKPFASCAATNKSHVNNYPISVQGGEDNNYDFKYVNGNLTITKRQLTVAAQDETIIYGNSIPTYTINYSGFVNSDTSDDLNSKPVASCTATNRSDVNNYPIIIQDGQDNNYDFKYVNGNLTITKRQLTATAQDETVIYGNSIPTFTVIYSGFVNSDTSDNLNSKPVASCTATNKSDVNIYPISVQGGEDNNYDFKYVNGNLTITKRQLTATAQDETIIYGNSIPTYTINYSGFVNSDTSDDLNSKPVASCTATNKSDVNNYPISVQDAEDNNYDFKYVNGSLTITKRQLTATAKDETVIYGNSIPTLTINYSGFVNSDTSDDLNSKPFASCAATNKSHVNNYPISVQGGEDNNYDFKYVNGNLTITKRQLTVTAKDETVIYGNSIPTLTINYSGFVNSDTSDDLNSKPFASCAATNKSHVNNYPITVQDGEDNNYDFKYVYGNLTITKRQLTATAQDETIIYGNSIPKFTINYIGFVNSDTSDELNSKPVASCTVTNKSDVNNYPITVQGGEDNNYDFKYVNGNLTITKRQLTAAAQDETIIYGNSIPRFTINYIGFVNSDTFDDLNCKPIASCKATNKSDVGMYQITVQDCEDNNYDFININGNLNIIKADQSITFNPINDQIIGNPPFQLSAISTSGLVINFISLNNDVVTVNGNEATIVGTGDATIRALQPGNENYNPAEPKDIMLSVSQPINDLNVLFAQNGTVSLSWKHLKERATYQIYRSQLEYGIFYPINPTIVNYKNFDNDHEKIIFHDKTVIDNYTYFYKVRVIFEGIENKEFSNTVKAEPKSLLLFDCQMHSFQEQIVKVGGIAKYEFLLTTRENFKGEVNLWCEGLDTNTTHEFQLNDKYIGSSIYNINNFPTLGRLIVRTGSATETSKKYDFKISIQNTWNGGSSEVLSIPLSLTVIPRSETGIHLFMPERKISYNHPCKFYGGIIPQEPDKKILLTIINDNDKETQIFKYVDTDVRGSYSDSIIVPSLGNYSIQASFIDNDSHTKVSAKIEFSVVKGMVNLMCFKSGNEKPEMDKDFTITVRTIPFLKYSPITLNVFNPDLNLSYQETIKTKVDGSFELSYPFFDRHSYIKGIWQFKAYWQGDYKTTGNESNTLLVPVGIDHGRVIIIGGGECKPENTYWEITKKLTLNAYRAFNRLGYSDDIIWFMINAENIDINYDGKTDHIVDNPLPTVDSIKTAIHTQFADTLNEDTPLIIYLMGHGNKDATFRVLGSDQIITAIELNDAIDTLQSKTQCKVLLILESCYSGNFLSYLKGRNRIVLTSAGDEEYNTDNTGTVAFSKDLFSKILEGDHLKKAFEYAKTKLIDLKYSTPQIDDNGDGISDYKDGSNAYQFYIGNKLTWVNKPEILNVQHPIILEPCSTNFEIKLETANSAWPITRVWGLIIPPHNNKNPESSVIKYQEVNFELTGKENEYYSIISGLNRPGIYKIVLSAEDANHNISEQKILFVNLSGKTGDLNCDYKIDIEDLIWGMQIISGMHKGFIFNLVDSNFDKKVGIEDILFVFKVLCDFEKLN